MKININKTEIQLGQDTIEAVIAHQSFCNKGLEWLLKNDPYCKKEHQFIEKITSCLSRDYKESIQYFSNQQQDKHLNAYIQNEDAFVNQLIEFITS